MVVDSLEKPRLISIHIKESKTDRLRKGATVTLGWKGENLSPVKALLAFMMLRKAGPGPFFRAQSGEALKRKGFVAEVKKALVCAAMQCHDISGHSFRIGAATAAAQNRTSDSEIKDFGRWRSREYQGYIRRDGVAGAALSKKLAGAGARL